MNLFDKAMQRPSNFNELNPQSQWAIDKSLGILDWDGNCNHQVNGMCQDCRCRWEERFPQLIKKTSEKK